MTKVIRTEISLEGISVSERKTLNARILQVGSPLDESRRYFAMPVSELSLVSDKGTKWEILCCTEHDHQELGPVPYCVYLELNAPNAVTGQDAEYGVSVIAAGLVAVELIRIWLAKNGLSREAVDQLEASDVSLHGTTVTYLIERGTKREVDEIMRAIWVTACALYPMWSGLRNSSEGVVTIPGFGFTVTFAPEAVAMRQGVADDVLDSVLGDRAPYRVRIEVRLRLRYLYHLGLAYLDDWHHGYETGIYHEVFDATVGRLLRLDDELRRRVPPARMCKHLSENEAALLRWVTRDRRDPAEFKGILDAKNPSALRRELRRQILEVAQVDIDIPWTRHTKLRCAELASWLAYPGDHNPPAERVPHCFCKANWPQVIWHLEQQCKAVFAMGAENRAASPVMS